MTSPTTPRDAIGLSERLREPNAAYTKHADGDPDLGRYIRWFKALGKEAATQLDAQAAQLVSLRADNDKMHDLVDQLTIVHHDVESKCDALSVENARLTDLANKRWLEIAAGRKEIDALSADNDQFRRVALDRLDKLTKAESRVKELDAELALMHKGECRDWTASNE